jgi:hypothetical protein
MSRTRRLLNLAAAGAILTLACAAPATWASAAGPPRPAATIPSVGSLDGIACPTSHTCVAVGNDESLNGKSVVINARTGSARAWSGSLASDSMNAVACPTTTTCLAVADDAVASVKASSGAMKVTDKPSKPKNGIVALGAIACPASTRCYAVGFEGSFASSTAIVIRLSGAGKSLAVMKDTGTGIGSIACPSASRCLISQASHSGLKIQLVDTSRFGVSHALPAKTFVDEIACYKASVCYALGGKITSGFSPVDEIFPLNPKTGAIGKVIKLTGFSGTGLACVNASRCLVVGFTGEGASAKPGLVTIVRGKPGKAAKVAPGGASYSAIGCASSTVCYAVGLAGGGAGAIVTKV